MVRHRHLLLCLCSCLVCPSRPSRCERRRRRRRVLVQEDAGRMTVVVRMKVVVKGLAGGEASSSTDIYI
jgi:hypothetical protein